MRICLYTETALPKVGGHETVVDALARQYQRMGHDVVVLAPHPRLPLRARDHTLPYRVVRHPRFFSTRYLVDWYQWYLLRLHRRCPFEVLHCHGLYPQSYLAALTRSRLRVPIVVTSHGGDLQADSPRVRKPVVRQRQAQGVAAADALVAIGRFTENGYLRLGADRTRIVRIPNGVHLEPFASRPARPAGLDPAICEGEYVLFLGRLKHRKGVDLLLRALAEIPARGGVELVIAGDGDERGDLQALARSLGVTERARFLGVVQGEEKIYLLQHARCSVVPTRIWEAFGLVVLESFAAGTAVLATRVSCLDDLVQPGQTGWLVPPESPKELAVVLTHVFGNAGEAKRLGRQAAQCARRYSWPAIAHQHLQMYAELLGCRQLKLAA
jgi:glycosyltransferase involved in cell wall biosynthesis